MRVGVEPWPVVGTHHAHAAYHGRLCHGSGRKYDISPDGERFLLINAGAGLEQAAAPIAPIVVQHFDEELKRLVPTK